MKIFNTDTQKYQELIIVDQINGIEWTADLIGNASKLVYSEENERYEMSSVDFDWWENIINELNLIDSKIETIKNLVAYDEFHVIQDRIYRVSDVNDLESHITFVTRELNDIAVEYQIVFK